MRLLSFMSLHSFADCDGKITKNFRIIVRRREKFGKRSTKKNTKIASLIPGSLLILNCQSFLRHRPNADRLHLDGVTTLWALQFLSDAVRLSHQPLAFLFALLRCYFHLVAATNGILIVNDELLALVDAVLVASPYVTFQPYNICVGSWQGST